MNSNYKYWVRFGDDNKMTGPYDLPTATKTAEGLAMGHVTATVLKEVDTVKFEDFYDNQVANNE